MDGPPSLYVEYCSRHKCSLDVSDCLERGAFIHRICVCKLDDDANYHTEYYEAARFWYSLITLRHMVVYDHHQAQNNQERGDHKGTCNEKPVMTHEPVSICVIVETRCDTPPPPQTRPCFLTLDVGEVYAG